MGKNRYNFCNANVISQFVLYSTDVTATDVTATDVTATDVTATDVIYQLSTQESEKKNQHSCIQLVVSLRDWTATSFIGWKEEIKLPLSQLVNWLHAGERNFKLEPRLRAMCVTISWADDRKAV